jgi:hypothetical protein
VGSPEEGVEEQFPHRELLLEGRNEVHLDDCPPAFLNVPLTEASTCDVYLSTR